MEDAKQYTITVTGSGTPLEIYEALIHLASSVNYEANIDWSEFHNCRTYEDPILFTEIKEK